MFEGKKDSVNRIFLTIKCKDEERVLGREEVELFRLAGFCNDLPIDRTHEYLLFQPCATVDKAQGTRRHFTICHLSHILKS